jgi:hypothetical protein
VWLIWPYVQDRFLTPVLPMLGLAGAYALQRAIERTPACIPAIGAARRRAGDSAAARGQRALAGHERAGRSALDRSRLSPYRTSWRG